MSEKDELLKELKANHDDQVAVATMVQNYKEGFIKELVGGVGTEMKQSIKTNTQPVKMKKPFKVRKNEFIDRLKNKFLMVFG